ncbi:hypothetical protein [Streptomyces sp. NPDC058394]|uniref:hypothetical protein n=1 Tax=Streptomyces sp. NPDC058394 TaxID=3346477 RepID=UPI003665345F
MTREQRRALLGDDVVEQIHQRIDEAPAAPDDAIEALRRIFARPATRSQPVPARRAA